MRAGPQRQWPSRRTQRALMASGPVPGRRGIPCQSSPSALASGHQQLAWRASVSLVCVRDRYPGNVLNRCSHVTVRTMSFEQDGLQVIRSRPLFALASLLVWICAKDWRACLVHSPSSSAVDEQWHNK